MKTLYTIAALLVLGSTSLADDLAAKRQAYLEAGKKQCDVAVAGLTDQIVEHQRKITAARKSGDTFYVRGWTENIKKYTQERDARKKAGFEHPLIVIQKPAKGQIGVLSHQQGSILFGRDPVATVEQVIDGENLIIEVAKKYRFWLHASTENVVDDQPYKLRGPYEVMGTKTYPTASGSQVTVFELTEFDPGPLP